MKEAAGLAAVLFWIGAGYHVLFANGETVITVILVLAAVVEMVNFAVQSGWLP